LGREYGHKANGQNGDGDHHLKDGKTGFPGHKFRFSKDSHGVFFA
jgi:hypothetical protein